MLLKTANCKNFKLQETISAFRVQKKGASVFFSGGGLLNSKNLVPRQCCGTGTVGTVTFCLSETGTGTVINYGSGSGKWNHKRKENTRYKFLGNNAPSVNTKRPDLF
jgi:hypothetical protein